MSEVRDLEQVIEDGMFSLEAIRVAHGILTLNLIEPLQGHAMNAVFVPKPCPICNAVEQFVDGKWQNVEHDYAVHNISLRPSHKRMEMSDLIGNPRLNEVIK